MLKYKAIPGFIWLVFIFVLCNMRPSSLPSDSWFVFKGIDKVVHAIFYFVFAWLFLPVFEYTKDKRNAIALTISTGFFYGVFIELMQQFVFTYRSADWRDVVANSIGLALGILSFPIVNSLFYRFNRNFK